MIPRARILVVTAVLAAGLIVTAAGLGRGQVRAPADFPMAKAESSPGQVTFSHQKHVTRVEKCTTCHMRDFKMKRGTSGPITLAAKQEGKFCGACHDGKTSIGGVTVFPIDECEKCHK